MPRRPAKITQADISRAIRATKNAGANEVAVDSEGTIRISLGQGLTIPAVLSDQGQAAAPATKASA
jgi:hypothetical protein